MNVGRSMVMALMRMRRFERVKTGNQQPPDWLRQKVCISKRNVSNLTVILQTIFQKCFANFTLVKIKGEKINNYKKTLPQEKKLQYKIIVEGGVIHDLLI